MSMFISDYFDIDFDKLGVFDAMMDIDSHYFINITKLKDATTREFRNSYEEVNDYFRNIAKLLDYSSSKGETDKCYREALRRFNFPEVNGINLGFSKCKHGTAFSDKLRNKVIADAYVIVKSGTKDPEIFHLLSLFEKDVGPDRLSDMIAGIIKDDIYTYTRRINIEAGIVPENYPNEVFNNGIVYNPYKNCDLLLLPKEILHELPIAKCWSDVDLVMSQNIAIRKEINQIIGEEWGKYSANQKKDYLKQKIFEDPERCQGVLVSYRNSHEGECDWECDLDYIAERIFRDIQKIGFKFLQHDAYNTEVSSQEAIRHISATFKDWVENNKGWEDILSISTNNREKIVQRLLHLCAKDYISVNNLDLSFESNSGRGPVDLKISRGTDKSICEIKLSSNDQYLHGFETQIEEYGKAENTEHLFYMFIDVGNPERLKKIEDLYQENAKADKQQPELIVIDSTMKKSASIRASSN